MPKRELGCHDVRTLAAAYVLGSLDRSTADAVRAHLASCAAPHPEFAELGGVVPYLAESVEPLEPPPGLRARLLAAASAEGRPGRIEESAPVHAVEADVTPSGQSRAPKAPWRWPLRPGLTWASLGVAVVVIAALGAWNLSLRSELQSAQTGSRALQELIAAGAAGGTSVQLAGGTAAPAARGIVVLHPAGPGYLVVTGLAAAAPGHVYEAWFIRSGQARPAGTFSVTPGGLGVLATPAPGGPLDVVAVTQEPAGGSTQPTGAIVLSGTLH